MQLISKLRAINSIALHMHIEFSLTLMGKQYAHEMSYGHLKLLAHSMNVNGKTDTEFNRSQIGF